MVCFLENFLRKIKEMNSPNLLISPSFMKWCFKNLGSLGRYWFYIRGYLDSIACTGEEGAAFVSLSHIPAGLLNMILSGCGSCAATGKVRVCLVTGPQFFCV